MAGETAQSAQEMTADRNHGSYGTYGTGPNRKEIEYEYE